MMHSSATSYLALLLAMHFFCGRTMQAAPADSTSPEELEVLGKMLDCSIEISRFKVAGGGKSELRVNKNGADTAKVDLAGVHEIVLMVCRGRGLGVRPREADGPDGMQIRIIVRETNGYQVLSVGYTIPGKSSMTRESAPGLPVLFDRVDLAADEMTRLGNLHIEFAGPAPRGTAAGEQRIDTNAGSTSK